VRAGHDQAILFELQTDTFEELKDSGVALGIDQEWAYTENLKANLKDRQILILSTDGVWDLFDFRINAVVKLLPARKGDGF
jgi:sigma-B regulation protein RsbU (phosphoserine phosphatase)